VRVLLCDDHVLFAESLATVLTDAGHDVVGVTHSPDAALAVLRVDPVDACLLDVGFGTDSILPWLGDLRAAAPRARLVLLTASVDAGVVASARAAGVHGVAHKSQHVTDMVAILERVHAGETVVDRSALTRPGAAGDRDMAHRLAARLTPREREALCQLVRGLDTTQLARAMGITWATARSHVQSVLTKLGVHSRLEAATVAVREGLVNAGTGEWRLG
jgi:two-component system, NarL family, nitrate/nitrite response regulator NarL